MGLWGVLWEIFKTVGPGAAPHLARALTGHRSIDLAEKRAQAAAQEMAEDLATMEERLSAAEERATSAERSAAAAEERSAAAENALSRAEAQLVEQRKVTGKWMLALLIWNCLITGTLVYLAVEMARR